MNIFGLFGREPKEKNQSFNRNSEVDNNNFAYTETLNSNTKQAPVSVFVPKSFSDVEKIIDALRSGKNSIVHLNDVKNETAIRILDLLSGAVYALRGDVYEMDKNVFMFSPSGLEIHT